MIYADAIQFLSGLQVFGARPGLETTRQLAALAGDPQDRLRFIHVAGTNGKGSTCAMLESIYHAAGLKVGLYTSPHLVSFRERIQVNRQLISETDVARMVAEICSWPDATKSHPTFFEFVTIMALRYFGEQRCDLVIWETGLGGRLDATNIVTPLASVITNISFDHTAWLGDTLAKIAAEKAGIIKPGVPVITTENKAEALAVIETKARELAAPLTTLTNTGHRTPNTQLPLPGEHQRVNAALALATVETLQPKIPVSADAIQRGLAAVDWPGRFQIIRRGAQTLILDGAHNPAGAEALRGALAEIAPGRRPALVLSILADKDWLLIAQTLAPLADRIYLAPASSQRALAPGELATACRAANPHAALTLCTSVAEALRAAANEPFVVITGSLYLIGEALEHLGLASTASERTLNEYGVAKK